MLSYRVSISVSLVSPPANGLDHRCCHSLCVRGLTLLLPPLGMRQPSKIRCMVMQPEPGRSSAVQLGDTLGMEDLLSAFRIADPVVEHEASKSNDNTIDGASVATRSSCLHGRCY